jgi:ATP-binding cassette subfamily B protein
MLDWIIWMTVIQIGLLVIESAVRFYFSYITAWLGQTVVKDMRIKVYEKVLGLNLRQFDQTPIGTLTTRTINDIEAINDIFSDGLVPNHCRPALHYFYFVIHVLCGLEINTGVSCSLSPS